MKTWTGVALVAAALAMASGCKNEQAAQPAAGKAAEAAGKAGEAAGKAAEAAGAAAAGGAEAAAKAAEAAGAAGAAAAAQGAEAAAQAAKAAGEAAAAAQAAGAAAAGQGAEAAAEAAKKAAEAAAAAGAQGAEAAAAAAAQAAQVAGAAAGAAGAAAAALESTDILGRAPVTQKAEVKHVLIGWKDLAPAYRGQMDPRAAARSKEEADTLAKQILDKVRAGDDIDALMKASSEDPGSAQTGRAYTATEDAALVPPFKKLSLRLEVGEAGLVQTAYGWHIIKRVQ